MKAVTLAITEVLVPGQAKDCSVTVWSPGGLKSKGQGKLGGGGMYCRQYKASEQRQHALYQDSTRPEAACTVVGQYKARGR